jgi:xanthine dehydrogenase accessory factor
MTPAELTDTDIAALARDLRARGEPFAIATVIRTAGATAAKPGAKALLDAHGVILQGWIGGGCVRGALAKATKRAMQQQQPQLISLHPQDVLDQKGVAAGDDVDGVRFARNGCPSKGSIDIFVETVLPLPELYIFGTSPVADALAGLAETFHWDISRALQGETHPTPLKGAGRMIVIATQGSDDLASLRTALAIPNLFMAFVGSRRKFASLAQKLAVEGISEEVLARVQAPAGLAINAVTPDEIALSIIAQLTNERRCDRRGETPGDD